MTPTSRLREKWTSPPPARPYCEHLLAPHRAQKPHAHRRQTDACLKSPMPSTSTNTLGRSRGTRLRCHSCFPYLSPLFAKKKNYNFFPLLSKLSIFPSPRNMFHITMPSCARCGACQGELSYNSMKSRKGIRVNLQPIDNFLFCGKKCHGIWAHAQTQRRQAQEHAIKRQKRMEQLRARIQRDSARLHACSIARQLPVPTRNSAGQYSAIIAPVNHWKRKQPPPAANLALSAPHISPSPEPNRQTAETPRPSTGCRYHFSTCLDNNCTIHYDDKVSNGYFPKSTKWRKPLPANDNPVVSTTEQLRCRMEEDAFRGT